MNEFILTGNTKDTGGAQKDAMRLCEDTVNNNPFN
jgi:hypothetical protein